VLNWTELGGIMDGIGRFYIMYRMSLFNEFNSIVLALSLALIVGGQ
jgi:hypothetical protein